MGPEPRTGPVVVSGSGFVPMAAMHLGRLRTVQRTGGLVGDTGAALVRINELVERDGGVRPFIDDLIANMLAWMQGRGHDIGPTGRALLGRTHVSRYA